MQNNVRRPRARPGARASSAPLVAAADRRGLRRCAASRRASSAWACGRSTCTRPKAQRPAVGRKKRSSNREVVRLELDRRAMRRAVGGVVPGVAIARERRRVGHAFLGDDPLERVEPVPIVGLAGIGIAGGLRALDLLAERRRPFGPGEQAALVQRERHGEGLRLPRLAEHRPFGVARNARHRRGARGAPRAADRSAASRCTPEIITPDRDTARTRRSRPSASGRHPGPTARGRRTPPCRATADRRPGRSRPNPETRGSRGTSSTTPSLPRA